MSRRNSHSGIPKFARVVGILLAVCVALVFVSQILLPAEKSDYKESDLVYEGQWIWIQEDGTVTEVVPTIRLSVKQGEEMVLETKLPTEISDKDFLWYHSSHQNVKMYLKDEEDYGNQEEGDLILTYDTSGHWYSGNNSPSKYVPLELNEEMAGKVLRVVAVSRSYFTGYFVRPNYGSSSNMWGHIASARAGALVIVSVLLILYAIIVLGCEMVKRVLKQRYISLTYLGWTCLSVGMWILFESNIRQLLFTNISIIANLAYVSMSFIGMTIVVYFDDIQDYRYHRFHMVVNGIVLLSTIVLIALHFLRIMDLTQSMMITYSQEPIIMITVLITVVWDIRRRRISEYIHSMLGFFGLCIGSAYELYVDLITGNENTGIYTGIGMIVFAGFAIYNTFRNQIAREKEKNRVVAIGEAKSQFLANMSHEIRTPINSVLGMNEMILRESSEKAILEYSASIESSSRLLLSIVNEILDFSKIEAGKMEICPVEYQLSSVLNDLVNTLSPKADEKGLQFEIKVDETIPDKLKGDEIRIKQIVINLVNNAIKYTHEGAVSLIVKGVYDIPGSLNLVIEVSDTGTGIKEQDIERLFEAFKRVDEERNRHIEGTGLGLSITESLVELMGGSISVKSKYGYGSTFIVQIPQKIVDRDPIGDFRKRAGLALDNKKKYQESFLAPKAKILVVDDNPSNLTVIKLLLKKTAIYVDTAGSGAKALELLKSEKYDIVLLDHMMPEMDGIETLMRIKEFYPDKKFPVIALTANAVSGAREEYLAAGFEDYMSKPILGEALERMLITWLPKDKVITPDMLGKRTKTETVTVTSDVNTTKTDVEAMKAEVEDKTMEYNSFEDLPVINRINWSEAEKFLPDMEVLMETLEVVTKGMPALADDVERFFDELRDENNEESMKNYQIKVHAMKSSVKMIGAGALSEEARIMEFAAKDGDYEKIMRGTMHLLMEWRALYRDLADFLKL